MFASRQSFRIEERNDFYVAPLALIALLGLLRGRRRAASRRARVAAALARRRAAGRRPVRALREHLGRLRHARPAAVVVAAGPRHPLRPAALRRARRRASSPRRRSSSCRAATRSSSRRSLARLLRAQLGGRRERPPRDPPGLGRRALRRHPRRASRLDRPAVGRDADVAFFWHYTGETRPLWNNEFFNRSVRGVYTLDGPDPADGGCPRRRSTSAANGKLVTAAGVAPRRALRGLVRGHRGHAARARRGDRPDALPRDGPMVVLTRDRRPLPGHLGGPHGRLPPRCAAPAARSPCASAPTSSCSTATRS